MWQQTVKPFDHALEMPVHHSSGNVWRQVLKTICWYVVLAPAGSEQITLLNTTAADKRLDQLPLHNDLLQAFLTKEVGLFRQHLRCCSSRSRQFPT